MWLQCCSVQTRESHAYRFHHSVVLQVASLEGRLQRGSPRSLSEIGAAGTAMLSPRFFTQAPTSTFHIVWIALKHFVSRSITLRKLPHTMLKALQTGNAHPSVECTAHSQQRYTWSEQQQEPNFKLLCCSISGRSLDQFSSAARHNQYALRGGGGVLVP